MRTLTHLATAALLSCSALSLHGQSTDFVATAEVRAMSGPHGVDGMLDRPAELAIRDVTLAEALEALRTRSNARIAFSPSLLPSSPRVSCTCTDLTVREALDHLLDGSGFRWMPVGSQVLIEPVRDAIAEGVAVQVASANLDFGEFRWIDDVAAEEVRTGIIQGRVTHRTAGRPLSPVQVYVEGTQRGTITSQSGEFQITGVPAGEVTVIAEMIGFARATSTVTVVSGETVTVNFTLAERALDLDGIVVTGTAGGSQRRAIGNVVASVDAEEILSRSPVANVDQLLGQRTAGVMMMPGTGQVGTGSAVRIRGTGSITQGNDPIVYIDGVRMDSDPRGGPGQRGGANISRLNDIHPADIQSIEIIKGPAAATLYGTEASNGVIQIITKRGATGAPQFDVTTRIGTNWLWAPETRAGMRWMPNPDDPSGEPFGFNAYALERDEGNGAIYGYGLLQSYNLGVRGGTDAVRYFASVSRDDDVGIVSHNWDKRLALRGNLELLLSENFTANIGSSYISSQTRLVQTSIQSDPFTNLVWANPRNLTDGRRGFRGAPPEDWELVQSRQDNDRSTSNMELRYQPRSWNTHRLVAGIDVSSYENFTLFPMLPEGASHFYGQQALGDKSVTRGTRRFVTVDYATSMDFQLGDYSLQPSFGFQYYKTENSGINASGQRFPAIPITTVSGGSVRDGGEFFTENSTVGVYVQQQVGWNNRVFVTGAVRADDNSAFGVEFDAAIYPKLSATWVISEEDFWRFDAVDQLRLRGAWGAAGQQPATFAASRLYNPFIGYRNQPALIPGAFGNPELKPERGEELEFGFDASFFDGRIDLEVSRYQKTIKDAIVARQLPPSTGFTGSQIVNIGRIAAWGNEIGVNARVFEGRNVRWDIDTQFATMENEIRSLGGESTIFGGTGLQHREGYSIADIFFREVVSAEIDAQGNLVSALCDGGTGPDGVHPGGAPVPCAQAPQVWQGNSQPTWQIGLGNSVTLFDNIRLYARIEGNGGHKQVNTEIRPIHNGNYSEGAVRRDNPILQAYRVHEVDRSAQYDASFLRLREVSASYDLPETLAERVGARRGSISFGVRNVAMLWTGEHGWSTPRDGHVRESVADMIIWDPEVRATGQNATGYQTIMPPTASATMTVRFSF
jgi:TonB-dependent starch-binding outer membrane protein SusC